MPDLGQLLLRWGSGEVQKAGADISTSPQRKLLQSAGRAELFQSVGFDSRSCPHSQLVNVGRSVDRDFQFARECLKFLF